MVFKKTFSSLLFEFILFQAAIALSVLTVNAQNPTLSWARRMGGTSQDQGAAISTDASGNVYSTGGFGGTADFDPGAGTFNLTAPGIDTDIYISKLDANGNFLWAKSMGATFDDIGLAIANRAGNIYIAGSFSGTVDFDPGTGTFNLSAGTDDDIFVLKLDANGNFVWARNMGSTDENDFAFGIAVDGSDNVYTTGEFREIGDFDPGASVFNLDAGASGDPNVFISKLDANGNFVWAKSFEGPTDSEYAYDVNVDGSGNVYTIGDFVTTVDFDPGTGVFNQTGPGVFISKLDNDGNFIWAKSVTSAGGFSMAVDNTGNVYTTGGFSNTADFDPGAGVFNLTSQGTNDIYLLKLNSSGNFVWAKSIGGTGTDAGYAIDLDDSGVYATGWFSATADFDPGTSTFNLTSAGLADIFIVRLDLSGNFSWAQRIGSTNYDAGYNVDVDGTGGIYTTGAFRLTPDFDPGTGTTNLTSAGSDDIFVHKMTTGGSAITINPQPTPATVCEGETANFTLTASGASNLTYQWQLFDGSVFNDITNTGGYTGATTSTLTINTTGKVGSSDYRCKVSGDLATDEFSNTVTLTVNAVPNAPTTIGDSYCVPASLTLTACCATAGQFRWYNVQTGGTAIAGQVNNSFNTPVVSTTTSYYASINNGQCESTRTEAVATIAPIAKPSITFDPPIITAGPNINLCEGDVQKFSAPSGFTFYSWSNGESTQEIIIDEDGTYSVTVEDADGCVSPSSDPLNVTINPYPIAEITINGTQLTSTPGDSYQWHQNGTEISEATESTFEFNVLEYGEYMVEVTDNGCTSLSDVFIYLITQNESLLPGWIIYPNPFHSMIFIEPASIHQWIEIEVTDGLGRSVKKMGGLTDSPFNLDELSDGQYFLHIHSNKKTHQVRITKQNEIH